MTIGLAGTFLLALTLAWRESWRQAAIESAIAESHFAETPEAASVEELSSAIARLTSAMPGEEDHAAAHQRLAELWVQSYRIRLLDQFRAENLGQTDARLWPGTSLTFLRQRATDFSEAGLGKSSTTCSRIPWSSKI